MASLTMAARLCFFEINHRLLLVHCRQKTEKGFDNNNYGPIGYTKTIVCVNRSTLYDILL
jgi:hypothetical protein